MTKQNKNKNKKKMPRINNQQRFNKVAPEAKENGCSNWIPVETLISNFPCWTSNGNGRKGKFLGLHKYIWEPKYEKGKCVAIRTTGFDKAVERAKMLKNRPIRPDIKKVMKTKNCLHCNKKGCIPDHKNDLYNDPRVHNKDKQQLSDFQPLCNACNLLKAKTFVKTEKQGKRQPAPHIITKFGLPEFIKGDETFNPNDIDGMVGTYWHDIEAYENHCKTLITLS